MFIEEFKDVKITYMRRTGAYGQENKELMEIFKTYLKQHGLFNESTVLLGIALDDPAEIPAAKQKYDVGIIITDEVDYALPTRKIADGRYAIFEIMHTEEAVMSFWKNLHKSIADLPVDTTKPVIERYSNSKINLHLCEICIPLK